MFKTPPLQLLRTYGSNTSANASRKLAIGRLPSIPSPRVIKGHLDQYIVGQDKSKRVLSVAVYNHYLRNHDKRRRLELQRARTLIWEEAQKREKEREEKQGFQSSESRAGLKNLQKQLLAQPDDELVLSKSNVLMVGPSGSGKTLMATTLAGVLDVPIAITDCTHLTQAGYIGDSVEVCIERLLVNADFDVSKAESGIIVLDEIDKLAKPAASMGTKDVSGEGVQQALLKIIEGHSVEISVKRPVKQGTDSKNNQTTTKKDETFVINTSNILFMIMGAFVGLDKHVIRRIQKAKNPEEQHNAEEDTEKLRFSNTIEEVDLGNGRKESALNLVTPTDLVSFGIIPELIGRVPIVTALQPLQRDDLYHILRDPKNALLEQYKYIFKQFGVELCVTEKALQKVAQFALREGTGARGLRGIMERLLLNVNYDCPDSGISYVLVTEDTVKSLQESDYSLNTNIDVNYYSRGEREKFIEDIYKEDNKLGKELDEKYGRISTREKEGKL
ncbi:BN860_12948g1_1 [Zygosaccharomyces bailii CLIB 213]|uniref:BN860_12948g1_1 n=1 Tax=Zygosaccharomyces bailii (strain CLIB 213 / ATCC 58445 / CBS 680 / BCRC 21525 / NBRC 1098 / NCYC 1416 / NRRL Y-2227) TaxID=1333698 RepID=A0A8J2T5S5_ZYGB2|nr:BN860_12948g1_1 [Zygosaccharomyces bailii CLIB 213]